MLVHSCFSAYIFSQSSNCVALPCLCAGLMESTVEAKALQLASTSKRGIARKEKEPVHPVQKKPKHSRRESTIDAQCISQDDYDDNMKKLHAELQSANPSRKVVRRLMKAMFPQRRAWITAEDSPTVPVILEQFPCLKRSKYVSTDIHWYQ